MSQCIDSFFFSLLFPLFWNTKSSHYLTYIIAQFHLYLYDNRFTTDVVSWHIQPVKLLISRTFLIITYKFFYFVNKLPFLPTPRKRKRPLPPSTVSRWCCSLCGSLFSIMVREHKELFFWPLPPLMCHYSQPAYNYSIENQALKAAQDEQRNRLNHIYSTIAGKVSHFTVAMMVCSISASH